MPVDSQLHEFLIETHRVVEFAPQILDHIEADLMDHGLQKKRLRQADRRFLEGQTPNLANLGIELRQGDPAKLELEVGRPRMEPYLAYLFLMLRGRLGGCNGGVTEVYRGCNGGATELQDKGLARFRGYSLGSNPNEALDLRLRLAAGPSGPAGAGDSANRQVGDLPHAPPT